MPLVCCRAPAIVGLDSHSIQVEAGLAMNGLTAWAERNSPAVIENVRSRDAIVANLVGLVLAGGFDVGPFFGPGLRSRTCHWLVTWFVITVLIALAYESTSCTELQ